MIALDSVSAKRRILFANLERGLILSAVVPSLESVHAIPLLDYGPFRCRPSDHHYFLGPSAAGSTDSDLTPASCFDGSLRLRSKLFSVSRWVRQVDFRNEINWWFGLGVRSLDSNGADRDTSEHRQSNYIFCFHCVSP